MLFMYVNLCSSQKKPMTKNYYYPHFMDEKTEELRN